MSVLQIGGLALFWVILGAIGVRSFRQAMLAVRYRSRLENEALPVRSARRRNASAKGRFRLWLFGAGFESQHAGTYFVLTQVFFILAAVSLTYFIFLTEWLTLAAEGLLSIPGNVGQLFIPILYVAPYLLALMIIILPFAYISGKRKRREERTEEELPIFLEYLVTLSEAGLGFDEALGRVLEVRKESSLLGSVFTKFRQEVLAGTSRLDAYWRLRERLQTHSVKTFASALIQAEHSGGSIAGILRQQGEDALERRRMKALEIVHTLPVRLLFPMMCCFLPGLMAVLLGPLLFRMIEAVESITRTIRG